MSSVRRIVIVLLASVGLLLAGAAAAPLASAAEPTVRTFVVPLSAENEVPGCPEGVVSGASGLAVIVVNGETGQISYRVVAFNLPATEDGTIDAFGHIHEGAAGERGPVVVPFDEGLTGRDSGLVASGTTTDLTVATGILADPANYYVNIHTSECTGGAIRGQLG